MRVLICGGRDFHSLAFVDRHMRMVKAKHPIEVIIEGGAQGADKLGACWAGMNGIPVLTFSADWEKHGKAAGPIRNRQMLDEGRPDLVVAFPGGKGTKNMVIEARKAGVNTWTPGWSA